MTRIPKSARIFWQNYLLSLLIFAGVVWLASIETDPFRHNWLQGYVTASFFAVLYASYRMAKDFWRSEKIEEFKKAQRITGGEFKAKYGDLLEYID